MVAVKCEKVDNTHDIKIFYIHDYHLNCGSAQATHISELIRNFPANIKAYCIGPGTDYPIEGYIKIPQIASNPMEPIISKILWHAINDCIELSYLLLLINHYKPDLFLIRSGIRISPFILSRIFDIPIILEINGLGIAERSLSRVNKRTYALVSIIESKLFNYAKKIIVVSPGIKQGLANMYNINLDKFVTISNGVNITLFKILDSEVCRNKLDLDVNSKYVCFVGSFAPWHGLEYLIKAAPSILKKVPNTKFILIGDGKEKEFIIQLINKLKLSNDFFFHDTIPHKEIPIYINACDVCVILKRKDIPGSPLKLREYMACGKPVIATRSTDFNILNESNAGILVNPENTVELSNAIVELLNNKNLCLNLGINGKNCVIKCYSWSMVALRVANVCYDVLKAIK